MKRSCIILTLVVCTFVHIKGDDPLWFQPQISLTAIKAELDKYPRDVDKRNTIGQTGLMYAVTENKFTNFGNATDHKGLVELLVAHGADVNAKSYQSPRGEDHSFNNTPLHYAAIQPNYRQTIPLLNYLIDAEALVNEKNSLGETPLMWAANLQLLEDKRQIIKEFIADLADVNLQNNIGDTYLHILVKNKDYIWVQEFIDTFGSMVDLSIKNVEGWTALDTARNTLQPESQRAIEGLKVIGLKDDVNTEDVLGRTGLMLAIMRNDFPFARRQLEKQSKVDAKDKTRFANTPLHLAVIRQFNVTPFVKLLLDYHANVNMKNNYGYTPLHYLVTYNNNSAERDAVAQMLINAGADPFIKNNKGRSSIDQARLKDPSFASKLQQWYEQRKNNMLSKKESKEPAELPKVSSLPKVEKVIEQNNVKSNDDTVAVQTNII